MKISNTLSQIDIYPKVVAVGRGVRLTLRSLDPDLLTSDSYRLDVWAINGDPYRVTFPNVPYIRLPGPCVGLSFELTFPDEQEYQLRLYDAQGKCAFITSVYALEDDMLRLHPLVGDFHVHTLFSDGSEGPAFVAAKYREAGFDFVAITDHRRYEPSLRAIAAYSDLDLPFHIYPGEEVHAPGTYIHIVNFGSDHSVSAISLADKTLGGWRDKSGDPTWLAEVEKLAAQLTELPDGVPAHTVASAMLVSREVRRGGGLCIFAHPHWRQKVHNVPDVVSEYLLRSGVFDAFELIGGQSWQENQSQLMMFEHMSRNGVDIPIVGNSDSHGTLEKRVGGANWPYRMFTEERTVVLAEENSRDAIVSAVRAGRTTAIQIFEGQYPQICGGSYRVKQYVLFLLENYYPLRDRLYAEEGRLMIEYIAGTPGARERLERTVAENSEFELKYILRD